MLCTEWKSVLLVTSLKRTVGRRNFIGGTSKGVISPMGRSLFFVSRNYQVVRDEGVSIGTLLRKVDNEDDESPSSVVMRWVVSFLDETEEEISENYIGRLAEGAKSDSSPSQSGKPNHKKTITKKKLPTAKGKAQRKVKFGIPEPEKQILVDAAATAAYNSRTHSTRSAVKKGGPEQTLYDGIQETRKTTKGGRKQVGTKEDDTVIKIKMLTGTLIMYRGVHRRAEFIWSV